MKTIFWLFENCPEARRTMQDRQSVITASYGYP
jgi:hypothetical protein